MPLPHLYINFISFHSRVLIPYQVYREYIFSVCPNIGIFPKSIYLRFIITLNYFGLLFVFLLFHFVF
jgi:hypothetical protein